MYNVAMTAKTKTTPRKTLNRRVQIRIDEETYDRIRALAHREQRSVSSQLVYEVLCALEERDLNARDESRLRQSG